MEPGRVKEILSELRDIWGQKRALDEREAALEHELAGGDEKPSAVAAAPRSAGKEARRDMLKSAAAARGVLADSAPPLKAKISGKADKVVEVPRWLRTKVLEKINEQPGRKFRAGEMAEEIDAIVHVAAVTACLVSLAEDGFIKRGRRFGPFWAQDDPEPQMGPTVASDDALDQERGEIDDVTVPPTQDELGEIGALS